MMWLNQQERGERAHEKRQRWKENIGLALQEGERDRVKRVVKTNSLPLINYWPKG